MDNNNRISDEYCRIIKKLIESGKIYPVKFLLYKKVNKNRMFNGHAKRWQRSIKALNPEELIQFDHMTGQVSEYGQVKHFNAICPKFPFLCFLLDFLNTMVV